MCSSDLLRTLAWQSCVGRIHGTQSVDKLNDFITPACDLRSVSLQRRATRSSVLHQRMLSDCKRSTAEENKHLMLMYISGGTNTLTLTYDKSLVPPGTKVVHVTLVVEEMAKGLVLAAEECLSFLFK